MQVVFFLCTPFKVISSVIVVVAVFVIDVCLPLYRRKECLCNKPVYSVCLMNTVNRQQYCRVYRRIIYSAQPPRFFPSYIPKIGNLIMVFKTNNWSPFFVFGIVFHNILSLISYSSIPSLPATDS